MKQQNCPSNGKGMLGSFFFFWCFLSKSSIIKYLYYEKGQIAKLIFLI